MMTVKEYASELGISIQEVLEKAKELGSKVNVTYTTNIDEALEGADFLFMQIRPGLNKQRAIDEKICLKGKFDDSKVWSGWCSSQL